MRLTDLDVRKLVITAGGTTRPLFYLITVRWRIPSSGRSGIDRSWWTWLPKKTGPRVQVLATAGW